MSEHDPGDASGDQAADWFVRLQSDAATGADWMAFEAWLLADEHHRQAFEAVESVWVDLELVRKAEPSPPSTVAVMAFKRPRKTLWPGWIAVGAAAAAAVVVTAFLRRPHDGPQRGDEHIVATLQGRHMALVLPDGSRLELNGGSQVRYRIGPGVRLATLAVGEAVFTVVHDPRRPFTVVAGDRRITDVGTIFDIKRQDQATEVTVKAGEVAVGSASGGDQGRISLNPGAQLLHQDGQPGSLIKTVDPDKVMAWRIDRLVYHDATLQTVVSDLNQHFQTPIHVKGQKTGELRFSGVLVLDSEDAVIERLQAFMPVVVERSEGALWLSSRR